jgi:hypothetical protein
VFPVRYELDSCILFGRNSVFKKIVSSLLLEYAIRLQFTYLLKKSVLYTGTGPKQVILTNIVFWAFTEF